MIASDTISKKLNADLPTDAYSLRLENTSNGLLSRTQPSNPRAAQMSLWIDDSATCDIWFGRAFSMEIESSEEHLLIDLVDAVIKGHISEDLWIRAESRIYSKSRILVNGRTVTTRHGIPFIYPPWWKRSYSYEPYL